LDNLAHTHSRGTPRALRHGTHSVVAMLMLLMLIMAIPAASAPIAGGSPSADSALFDPVSIEDFYSYDDSFPFEPCVAMLDSNEWYQHYDVQYQSEGDTVYAHYFVPVLPRSAGNPAIIGLHGMFSGSDQQFWVAAQFVAKRGIAGFTPSMPYHHRRSKGIQLFSGQKFILDSPQAIRGNIRRAVIDMRRAMDWLSRRPEIDPHAVSMAGASLGGIVASLSYKVEPRFRTGVFVMAGSGVSGIAENSEHPLVAAFREISKARLLDPQSFVGMLRPVDASVAPNSYTLMEFSTAHTELARPATAAVVLPTSSASPAASLPSPGDLCTSLSTYFSASAAVAALSSKISWDKLKTLEHFHNAPDKWPIWSYSPPSYLEASGDTGNSP
jgi:dienelactone hydrolase